MTDSLEEFLRRGVAAQDAVDAEIAKQQSRPFEPGETLVVRPSDSDDHEANQRAGSRCTFVRYAEAPGALGTFAVVKFAEKGRYVYMRREDLAREERG